MTNEQILAGILAAKSKINLLRFRHTQCDLPLADAKLTRVAAYLADEAAAVEAQIWEEAGVCA